MTQSNVPRCSSTLDFQKGASSCTASTPRLRNFAVLIPACTSGTNVSTCRSQIVTKAVHKLAVAAADFSHKRCSYSCNLVVVTNYPISSYPERLSSEEWSSLITHKSTANTNHFRYCQKNREWAKHLHSTA